MTNWRQTFTNTFGSLLLPGVICTTSSPLKPEPWLYPCGCTVNPKCNSQRCFFSKPAFSRADMERRRYWGKPQSSLFPLLKNWRLYTFLPAVPVPWPQQSYGGTVMAWGCCQGMNVPAVQSRGPRVLTLGSTATFFLLKGLKLFVLASQAHPEQLTGCSGSHKSFLFHFGFIVISLQILPR